MIERVVALFFGRRVVVWVVFLFVAAYGAYCWTRLPLEAYPDIADTTSQVITQVPGLAAEEVEKQITIPLEREIMGTPGMQVMRSKSTFGLSLITVVFRDGAEDYWSRQRLQERISGVELPYGAQPGLDPLTSPIGEIYRYTLESKTRDLRALSELQFWKVIPRLKQVPGIADVSNFGGMTTRFLLKLDPQKLGKYNVSLAQITQAINANNANAGGSVINRGEQAFVVRGVGLISGLEDLGSVVVTQKRGVPVLVRDLGDVVLGQQERHGVLGKDADPDTIEGIVLLLKGENPSRVLEGVHAAVRELNENDLPKDVRIVPYLDRTTLVSATVHTVARTLLEGMIVVTLVLLLFLGSVRAALIVASHDPVVAARRVHIHAPFGDSGQPPVVRRDRFRHHRGRRDLRGRRHFAASGVRWRRSDGRLGAGGDGQRCARRVLRHVDNHHGLSASLRFRADRIQALLPDGLCDRLRVDRRARSWRSRSSRDSCSKRSATRHACSKARCSIA